MQHVQDVTPEDAKSLIERFGIKKSVIARDTGLHRAEVYAFLEPDRYPHIRLSDEKRTRIEKWFRDIAA